MIFLAALAIAIVISFVCKPAIKKYPGVFYILAGALDVLFIVSAYTTNTVPAPLHSFAFMFIQKCTLSVAFFVVVMYIGTFSRESKIRLWLMPIRAELSIIACILAIGHIAVYLSSYVPRALAGMGTASGTVTAALVVALVLFALILVLGVTSFRVVKKRMTAKAWKTLQRWAYVFYGFIYLHMVLMLLPSAMRGGAAAQVSVGVYTIVFGVYAIARVLRWRADVAAQHEVDLGDNVFSD